jgi:hypothetical protein
MTPEKDFGLFELAAALVVIRLDQNAILARDHVYYNETNWYVFFPSCRHAQNTLQILHRKLAYNVSYKIVFSAHLE